MNEKTAKTETIKIVSNWQLLRLPQGRRKRITAKVPAFCAFRRPEFDPLKGGLMIEMLEVDDQPVLALDEPLEVINAEAIWAQFEAAGSRGEELVMDLRNRTSAPWIGRVRFVFERKIKAPEEPKEAVQ